MENPNEISHSTKHLNEVKSFYTFVAIVFVGITVLQPLSMLAVMFINALIQAQ